MTDHDTWGTEYPTCPKCGTADQDWWDGHLGRELKGDGDASTYECHNCGHKVRVRMCVSFSFMTEDAK
jgi:DNA-directed RNA polymerase subunit M/transcription elongation factor TFIIS